MLSSLVGLHWGAHFLTASTGWAGSGMALSSRAHAFSVEALVGKGAKRKLPDCGGEKEPGRAEPAEEQGAGGGRTHEPGQYPPRAPCSEPAAQPAPPQRDLGPAGAGRAAGARGERPHGACPALRAGTSTAGPCAVAETSGTPPPAARPQCKG